MSLRRWEIRSLGSAGEPLTGDRAGSTLNWKYDWKWRATLGNRGSRRGKARHRSADPRGVGGRARLPAPTLVDDPIESQLDPPEPRRSLRGLLERPDQRQVPPEEWDAAREEAWAAAAREAEERKK